MANAVVLLAQGFEEIEAVTIIDVLRRGGVKVTVAALGESPVRGVHEISVAADLAIDAVKPENFDAIVLPGGTPGAKRLREDPRVLELIRRFNSENKLTAAICAAPTALEAAGVLRGRRATSYPGNALPSARYEEAKVVEDGNILTSRGPGTAMDFALAVLARLAGPEAATTERGRLLYNPA